MAVNKIIVESHSRSAGLYQVRWQLNNAVDGVSDEMLDMTLEQAIASAHKLAERVRTTRGIKVKEKNIIIDEKSVMKNAIRDESSRRYLESKKVMIG